jgi:cyanoexosortase A
MNITNISPTRLLRQPQFWLLTLTAGLFAIYLTLLWRAKDIAHLGMSGLFLLVVGSIIWDKRNNLKFNSSILYKVIGILLIGWILINLPLSPHKNKLEPFLRSSPFIFAVGLSLIASGLKGIRLYWRELAILFFLGMPAVIALWLKFNPSSITAQFAAFILWCINLNPVREGVYIYLPTGAVEVNKGCSGLEAMNYLLGISVIMLIMFPLKQIYNVIVPIVAISLGFIVNGFRVALLALFVASNKMEAFKYWHEGEGSLMVGMVAIGLFIIFYFLLIKFSDIEGLNDADA